MTKKATSKTTANKLETRGRKFNASKYAINRAWEIAKNAAVAHNTNPLNVAQKGLVKPSEFFAESLTLAWTEAKAKQTRTTIDMYKLHKVPKKSLNKILNSVAGFIVVNQLAKTNSKDTTASIITKGAKASGSYKVELSTRIFDARFTTPAARSTNRHTLHALGGVANTGNVPSNLEDKMAY